MKELTTELYDEIVRVWNDDPSAIYDAYEMNAIRKELRYDIDSWDSEESDY
tara:strand:- start:385 stop:537 length:153 start_codon:yes stop_codon:yes gene_type:complete